MIKKFIYKLFPGLVPSGRLPRDMTPVDAKDIMGKIQDIRIIQNRFGMSKDELRVNVLTVNTNKKMDYMDWFELEEFHVEQRDQQGATDPSSDGGLREIDIIVNAIEAEIDRRGADE